MSFVPSPARPEVLIDPVLRDHITFDYDAFHEIARREGETEESIAQYRTRFRAKYNANWLGFYRYSTKTSQIYVGSCIQVVKSDLKDMGFKGEGHLDTVISAKINHVSLHEYGHHVMKHSSFILDVACQLKGNVLEMRGKPYDELPNEVGLTDFANRNRDIKIVSYHS